MAFNWNKMQSTPAGSLERKQAAMPVLELADLFEKQAVRDLDLGEKWGGLVRDITIDIDRLTDDTQAESAAFEIVRRHREYLSDEKNLDDEKEAAGYVISVAREIKRRRPKTH